MHRTEFQQPDDDVGHMTVVWTIGAVLGGVLTVLASALVVLVSWQCMQYRRLRPTLDGRPLPSRYSWTCLWPQERIHHDGTALAEIMRLL
jgi:hypothetical protein